MAKGKIIGKAIHEGNFELPKEHIPFIKVPIGGSNCGNCKFLAKDGGHCANKYFIEWYGTSLLPKPVNRYCSDFYEPNPKFMGHRGKIVKKVKRVK